MAYYNWGEVAQRDQLFLHARRQQPWLPTCLEMCIRGWVLHSDQRQIRRRSSLWSGSPCGNLCSKTILHLSSFNLFHHLCMGTCSAKHCYESISFSFFMRGLVFFNKISPLKFSRILFCCHMRMPLSLFLQITLFYQDGGLWSSRISTFVAWKCELSFRLNGLDSVLSTSQAPLAKRRHAKSTQNCVNVKNPELACADVLNEFLTRLALTDPFMDGDSFLLLPSWRHSFAIRALKSSIPLPKGVDFRQ